MASSTNYLTRFQQEISRIVAEIETCIHSDGESEDREFRLQHEAFQERCDQAEHFSRKMALNGLKQWSVMDGDAHRIREALKRSLAYFRQTGH